MFGLAPNIGDADRLVRIIAGLVLIGGGVLHLVAPQTWTGVWMFVGIVPLLTGLVRVCPAYLPFRLSTRTRGGDKLA